MDAKYCLTCGEKVEKPKRGPTGDYCGPACKQKAYRQREFERKRVMLSTRPQKKT